MAFELEFVNQYQGRIPVVKSVRDVALYKGQLGNDVYSNFEVQGGSYTDDQGNTVSFDGITIDTVLMSVTGGNNVVKTDIQGAPGTTKEYIAKKDFTINISMIIAGDNGIYPRDVVDQLLRILSAPVPINVNSWYLTMFGIYQIVIEDFTFAQIAGGQSQQNVEIQAVSDIPVILQIQ